MSNKTNIIVPFVVMVVVLGVRCHVVTEYSIDPVENTGLCVSAALSLLLSLYNLMKGSKK